MRRNYSRLWLDFLDAEKEFDQILQYIPFSNENNVTHSPKIASLIVKSCSRLESFIKYSIQSSLFDYINEMGFSNLHRHYDINNLDRLNITRFRAIFDSIYHFSSLKVIFKYEPNRILEPFRDWQTQNSPFWWITYNKLKHNYYQNIELGTLKEVLFALSGWFLFIVVHIESFNWLIHHTRIIRSNEKLNLLFRNLKTPNEIKVEFNLKKEFNEELLELDASNNLVKTNLHYYNDSFNLNREIFTNLEQWKSYFQPLKFPIKVVAETKYFLYLYNTPVSTGIEEKLLKNDYFSIGIPNLGRG